MKIHTCKFLKVGVNDIMTDMNMSSFQQRITINLGKISHKFKSQVYNGRVKSTKVDPKLNW